MSSAILIHLKYELSAALSAERSVASHVQGHFPLGTVYGHMGTGNLSPYLRGKSTHNGICMRAIQSESRPRHCSPSFNDLLNVRAFLIEDLRAALLALYAYGIYI